MCGFYKLIFLLICIGAITGSCAEVVPSPDAAAEEQIVRLSNIAAITEGKLERTKRGLLDYLLYGLYEYFDYSEESDSEEEEKYLICRNCTIIISQSNDQGSPAKQSTMAPVTVPTDKKGPNGGDTPAVSPSKVPTLTEETESVPIPLAEPLDT
uniref:Myb-like protein J n=1 Tax=Zeugodacus cucurbitae TaxID=28588 RepID=A0A0A1X3Z3_ZEUCU